MTATEPTHLTVTRLIRAPREKVFQAWIDPALRRRWWSFGGKGKLSVCEIDARVGGAYRMHQVGGCDGDVAGYPPDYEWIMSGEFVEITPPERLVFTWNVNHREEPVVDQRVTVELRETPEGTALTLTHSGVMSTKMRDGTHRGWSALVENIAGMLAEGE